MSKIIKVGEVEINNKYMYLPDVVLKGNCNKCKSELSLDMGNGSHVSMPTTNKKETVWCYCEKCDDHAPIDIVIRMTVEQI